MSLTKTNKKGLENKQKVIEDIMACAEKYPNVFIFSVDNMRNHTLKHIRSEWKDSRFFFGKNAIMRLGLKQAELDDDLCEQVEGQRGLLFTTHDKDTVVSDLEAFNETRILRESSFQIDWFEEYSAAEFARSGFKAKESVISNPAAPISQSLEHFHSF